MILRLSLRLPEDEVYVRTTRLLSRCLLEDIKVDRGTIGDKATRFEVTLEYYEPKVVITVTDEGEGFVKEDVPPSARRGPTARGASGWAAGVCPCSKGCRTSWTSDKLDFTTTDPHGTTVRVEKLQYDTQGDADEATERDKGGGGGDPCRSERKTSGRASGLFSDFFRIISSGLFLHGKRSGNRVSVNFISLIRCFCQLFSFKVPATAGGIQTTERNIRE